MVVSESALFQLSLDSTRCCAESQAWLLQLLWRALRKQRPIEQGAGGEGKPW